MAITMTDAAITRVVQLKTMRQAETEYLRVGIKTGGCSGMNYTLEFVAEPHPKDRVFTFAQDVRVCIDPKSYLFMNGTEIDFKQDLMNASFEFNNPLAKSTCQCGESFSM